MRSFKFAANCDTKDLPNVVNSLAWRWCTVDGKRCANSNEYPKYKKGQVRANKKRNCRIRPADGASLATQARKGNDETKSISCYVDCLVDSSRNYSVVCSLQNIASFAFSRLSRRAIDRIITATWIEETVHTRLHSPRWLEPGHRKTSGTPRQLTCQAFLHHTSWKHNCFDTCVGRV